MDFFNENNHQYSARAIKVVGIGENAGRTLESIQGILSKEIESWVINDDPNFLSKTTIKRKINFSNTENQDLASQQLAFIENEIQLSQIFDEETKLIFIVVNAANENVRSIALQLSQLAREKDVLNIGMAILPSKDLSIDLRKKAEISLTALMTTCNGMMVLDPDVFADENPSFSAYMIDSQMKCLLASTICSIEKLMTSKGVVNMDFEDLKQNIQDAIFIKHASGVGYGVQRSLEAIKEVLSKMDTQYAHNEDMKTVLLSLIVKDVNHFRIDDIDCITDYLKKELKHDIDVSFGVYENPSFLEDDVLKIQVIMA
ncbi:FtsZ/tubulin family protein [Sediminitomix flava]|uniref:Cell division GTPase FtsZ n=1 Tax=Sediminitomix flava TaxID=379075 RepID=A0A315ZAU2_SEDFL|nr:hypothetical protein [Sediminitomix flava]PWJ42470.1 cell division GTPase FtsZ [Sediminitomix flava]